MKIVLDEGVPEPLAHLLPAFEVHTVDSLGWKGIKNGKLLQLVEVFQAKAFITADKNIESQQRLRDRSFATIVLTTNSWPLLRDHGDTIRNALFRCQPGALLIADCGTFLPRRFRK